jgi:hypothetical protein
MQPQTEGMVLKFLELYLLVLLLLLKQEKLYPALIQMY